MHDHECRYCEENFVCELDAAECFRKYIVCRECFWRHDFIYFLLVFALALVAIALSLFLFEHAKKPTVDTPSAFFHPLTFNGNAIAATGERTNEKYRNQIGKAS